MTMFTRRTLFGGLAGLLPWRWFGRKRPKFELTIEPVGPVALNTYDGKFVSYTVHASMNGKPAELTVVTVHSNDWGRLTRAKVLTIHSGEDIFPDLTRWLQANPDVWVSRYTEPPKEAEKP